MRLYAIRASEHVHRGFGNEISDAGGGPDSLHVSMGVVAVLTLAIVVSITALSVDRQGRGGASTMASAMSHLPVGG